MKVLRSNGENAMRVYAMLEVRSSRDEPRLEIARVRIVDPRDTATADGRVPHVRSGPRNVEQKVWPVPAPPAIDLPDRLPATKAQRVFIDPDLVAKWREEANRKEST